MSLFTPAFKKRTSLKIAITGPSGSGKTWGALTLAKGMGKKIALIDTENGSASLYSKDFKFDTIQIDPPFENKKFFDTIHDAEKSGYDVLIIDSISHQWAGKGGLLKKKEAMDERGGNSFTNWGKIGNEHEDFKDAILRSPIHIIATMRSKQAHAVQTNDKGKPVPVKVGLEPIQREGIEYEFSVVFKISQDHFFTADKDRTQLFDGRSEKLSPSHGAELLAFMEDSVLMVTQEERLLLKRMMEELKWTDEEMKDFVGSAGVATSKDLTEDQFESLKEILEGKINERASA